MLKTYKSYRNYYNNQHMHLYHIHKYIPSHKLTVIIKESF